MKRFLIIVFIIIFNLIICKCEKYKVIFKKNSDEEYEGYFKDGKKNRDNKRIPLELGDIIIFNMNIENLPKVELEIKVSYIHRYKFFFSKKKYGLYSRKRNPPKYNEDFYIEVRFVNISDNNSKYKKYFILNKNKIYYAVPFIKCELEIYLRLNNIAKTYESRSITYEERQYIDEEVRKSGCTLEAIDLSPNPPPHIKEYITLNIEIKRIKK